MVEQLRLTVYVDRLDETSSNVSTSLELETVLGYSTREWAEDEELVLSKPIRADELAAARCRATPHGADEYVRVGSALATAREERRRA